MSWNDVTILLRLPFSLARFCTPPEVKFDIFRHSKRGKKSRYRIFSFAVLVRTLYRFYQGNKKISVIYTLSLKGYRGQIRRLYTYAANESCLLFLTVQSARRKFYPNRVNTQFLIILKNVFGKETSTKLSDLFSSFFAMYRSKMLPEDSQIKRLAFRL